MREICVKCNEIANNIFADISTKNECKKAFLDNGLQSRVCRQPKKKEGTLLGNQQRMKTGHTNERRRRRKVFYGKNGDVCSSSPYETQADTEPPGRGKKFLGPG